jgi:hypothetical protein
MLLVQIRLRPQLGVPLYDSEQTVQVPHATMHFFNISFWYNQQTNQLYQLRLYTPFAGHA